CPNYHFNCIGNQYTQDEIFQKIKQTSEGFRWV
ncbi:MAG: hypothetical protein ACJA2S_004897, partial [Cyclobacteriaceae bacterium]